MVTDAQVGLLRKKVEEGKTIATAAAAAGISERSAYAWKQGALPSDTKSARTWRTRPDPFDSVGYELTTPRNGRIDIRAELFFTAARKRSLGHESQGRPCGKCGPGSIAPAGDS